MNSSASQRPPSRFAKVLALVLAVAFLVVYVIYASGGFKPEDDAQIEGPVETDVQDGFLNEPMIMPSSKTISQPIFPVRPPPDSEVEPVTDSP